MGGALTVTCNLSHVNAGEGVKRALSFTGTRVDLVFKPGADKGVSVLVDGKQPSTIPSLYSFTRVSPFPMSDWPVLLRVSALTPLLAEDWSFKLDQLNSDGKLCHFSLHGSISGKDGEGWSTNRFVSNSGRIVIEPDDWNPAYCISVFKRPIPENATVRITSGFGSSSSCTGGRRPKPPVP